MNGEQVLQITLAILGVYFLYTVFITKDNKLFGGEEEATNSENVQNNQPNVNVEMNSINNNEVNNVEEEVLINDVDVDGVEEEELYNINNSNNIVQENSNNNGCVSKKLLPEDLLPKDQDNIWSNGQDNKMNYLESGHHIGINTVGQSLKNANRQLRSEPANPRDDVSPWNQSTIEHDKYRKQLELGEANTNEINEVSQ